MIERRYLNCLGDGRFKQFAIIEADAVSKQILSTTLLTPPPHEPGVLPRWLEPLGANVIIAGGMGQGAQNLFARSGIEIKTGKSGSTPEELVSAFLNGVLVSGASSCKHDGH